MGSRVAAITIIDDAFDSPQIISLSGTGVTVAPGATPMPANLVFTGQLTSSASSPQVITFTNTGNGPLSISNMTITGANSADFVQSNTCATSLAAQASCTISITFTPTATGNRTASLSVTDNASGSPQIVPLSGTGTDFSLAIASGSNCPANGNCSTSAVILAGQNATYNLQVTPAGGFTGSVALSCSGAPTPSTCTVSPSVLSPGGSSTYAFTVNVTGTSTVVATAPPRGQLLTQPWI